MRTIGTHIATALLASLVATSSIAGEIPIFGGGGSFSTVNVKSLKDMNFERIIPQKYDFSCGSAALATLLTYHYNHPVEESRLIADMYEIGDQEKIRKEGFSMLDMKAFVESMGYVANGYKVSLDQLKSAGVPAIILINTRGYMHFVVVKGVTDKYVLLGDPATGMKIVERQELQDSWNSIVFVIENSMDVGRDNFNQVADWKVHRKFPLEGILDNTTLAGFTVSSSYMPNYY